jgi:hypothetical protein
LWTPGYNRVTGSGCFNILIKKKKTLTSPTKKKNITIDITEKEKVEKRQTTQNFYTRRGYIDI